MAEQKLDPKVKVFVDRYNLDVLLDKALALMNDSDATLLRDMTKKLQNEMTDRHGELIKFDLAFEALPHLLDVKEHSLTICVEALKANKICFFAYVLHFAPPEKEHAWRTLRRHATNNKRADALQLINALHKFSDA